MKRYVRAAKLDQKKIYISASNRKDVMEVLDDDDIEEFATDYVKGVIHEYEYDLECAKKYGWKKPKKLNPDMAARRGMKWFVSDVANGVIVDLVGYKVSNDTRAKMLNVFEEVANKLI